jgi:cytochrome c-type biogenesis protein CcmH/NrfG
LTALGKVHLAEGKNEEAVAAFRDALKSDMDSIETMALLANALTRSARGDEALLLLRKAIERQAHRLGAEIERTAKICWIG